MSTSHTALERTGSDLLCCAIMLAFLICGCRNQPAAVSRPVVKSSADDVDSRVAVDVGETTDMGQPAILEAARVEPAARGELSENEELFIDGLRAAHPERVVLHYRVDLTETACSPFVSLQGFKTRDCARTVGMAHDATSSGWANQFGRVEFSPFSVTHDGDALSSVESACQNWVATKRALDFCQEYKSAAYYPGWYSYTLRPSSLVGPIVSFAILTARDGSGTVNSYAEEAQSFDVRTGDEAAFDALVTTDSLLAALKADSYLRKSLGAKLQGANTVQDVWKLWGVEGFWRFGGYYFYQWSAKRGEVAMRIPFLESRDGLSPNNLRSLGLWVEPKQEFRVTFEAAARREGGFLGNP